MIERTMALFIVRYPSENDLFLELGDVFTEREFKIAKTLIPEMKLIEVHTDNGIENDHVSKANWRNKYD